MDVNSTFLNGILSEKVYVEQHKGFKDTKLPNHVYRLEKALYGLKQALRSWYERFITYLLEKGFEREGLDKPLFIRKNKTRPLVA